MPILLDFESRSRADLPKVGGRNYWAHPSTEAILCSWYDTDTGDVGAWIPGDAAPPWAGAPGLSWAAHNSTDFDRFGMYRLGWASPADDWIDTSEAARRSGLPGKLDALAKRWLGREKDKKGNAYVKSLSRPSRAKARLGQLPPIDYDRVIPYGVSDVEVMADGWPLLEPWLQLEPDVLATDRIVNERGICFDVQLAARLLEEDARNAEIVCAGVARELGGPAYGWTAETVAETARSPEQFCAVTGAANAQAETVQDLDHPLARAREALASIASGKLRAGLRRVSPDGRLRDSHRYYGAHTGRWSGRGMQLQNMPRPEKRFEDWTDEMICRRAEEVLAGGHCDQGEIDLLLRATLHAKPGHTLIDWDFAGVEARGNAWCARDDDAVEIFREGKLDAYKVMAALIFGCTYEEIGKDDRRTLGKIAELACGYGMGAECQGCVKNQPHKKHAGFRYTANKGLRAEKRGSLESMGIDPADVVGAWRAQHAPIVRFWRELEDCFQSAAAGREAHAAGGRGGFSFQPSDDGGDVAIFLPSGRPIVYNHVRTIRGERGRTSLAYLGTKGYEHIYGGKLCENVISGMCRDLMARALVTLEIDGLDPCLHVHDSIACEVPIQAAAEATAHVKRTMLDLPDWADGFPIGAAGHTGTRHRK